ncbi:MAG: Gfo/Idh/MocA family oxidoreductase [Candidatus Aminicenantes bacterium]|nr:Gfo/Idh/MocA family oxidoreductase [Candidatus Aminicenantes bacterium]
MDKKVRTGVIGLGKMGILHSALINMIPKAELVAVHDAQKKLSKYVENAGLNVPFYADLEEMLDTAELDAVFICTPPFTHLPVAHRCVERGLDVFVEKPLAESLDSAGKMVDLIADKNIIHAAGFTIAHVPLFSKAREIIEGGALKKISRFNFSIYISEVLKKRKGWFYDKSKSGGGVVIDIASHGIFLLNKCFGLPESLYAKTLSFYSNVEDSGSAIIQYPEGVIGFVDANWSLPGFRQSATEIVIEGENGCLEVTNDYIKLYLHTSVPPYEAGWTDIHKIDLGSTADFALGSEGFYEEDTHFIECSLQRKDPLATWEDGLNVQKVIEAVYRSSESGYSVVLDDIT